MPQMITIGETMASFIPDCDGALRYVDNYHLRIAGAESNVAIGVAKLGVHVSWISRIGSDEFGHFIRNKVRSEGVDCQNLIVDKEHPTGIMFKETGAGETKVFYYRKGSAASHMCPSDLDVSVFQASSLLHMTGITPVLSNSCMEMTNAAFDLAKKNHMVISFDPNIRKKLWNQHDYAPYIRDLTLKSHIVMLGLDEAEVLFNSREPKEIISHLFEHGEATQVAIKDGGNGAIVADHAEIHVLPPYPCHCIEPIGAGDGFNAGFLAGYLMQKDILTAGRMGSICGALATETPGDTEGYPDKEHLDALLANAQVIYR